MYGHGTGGRSRARTPPLCTAAYAVAHPFSRGIVRNGRAGSVGRAIRALAVGLRRAPPGTGHAAQQGQGLLWTLGSVACRGLRLRPPAPGARKTGCRRFTGGRVIHHDGRAGTLRPGWVRSARRLRHRCPIPMRRQRLPALKRCRQARARGKEARPDPCGLEGQPRRRVNNMRHGSVAVHYFGAYFEAASAWQAAAICRCPAPDRPYALPRDTTSLRGAEPRGTQNQCEVRFLAFPF